jgi:TonB family protein
MKALKLLSAILGFTLLMSVNALALQLQSVLYVSDKLDDYWLSEKKVAPIYPSRAAIKGKGGCATVLFIIEADGSTSNHRVVAAYPKRIFDRASIQAAKQFLYKPSEKNAIREPVYITNTFTYQLLTGRKSGDDEKGEKLGDKCTNAAETILAEESGKTTEG